MVKAIRRGLKNLEELERVEKEEAEAERARVATTVQAVVSEKLAAVTMDPFFKGFN